MSGSGYMSEVGTDSAVRRESEFYPLIGSVLISSLGYNAVPSGLNLIRVGRFVASSSNVGKPDSLMISGAGVRLQHACVSSYVHADNDVD